MTYALGIYLLHLLIGFLSPKTDIDRWVRSAVFSAILSVFSASLAARCLAMACRYFARAVAEPCPVCRQAAAADGGLGVEGVRAAAVRVQDVVRTLPPNPPAPFLVAHRRRARPQLQTDSAACTRPPSRCRCHVSLISLRLRRPQVVGRQGGRVGVRRDLHPLLRHPCVLADLGDLLFRAVLHDDAPPDCAYVEAQVHPVRYGEAVLQGNGPPPRFSSGLSKSARPKQLSLRRDRSSGTAADGAAFLFGPQKDTGKRDEALPGTTPLDDVIAALLPLDLESWR